MSPEQLAARLGEAIPKQLKCVVLYGSAAAGDFVPGASNFNLLLLIDPLTTTQLDAIRPAIADWSRAGHAPPLMFTPKQLADSADAFPIELLDIQQSRRVLWGPDILAAMHVHREHLRLQIERELTGKLSRLRRGYLLTAGKPKAITELMAKSLSTILVLFRGALRIYQDEVPATKVDALHALARHIDFDVKPFEQLLELKKHSGKTPDAPPIRFDAYLTAIETVVGAINLQSQP